MYVQKIKSLFAFYANLIKFKHVR